MKLTEKQKLELELLKKCIDFFVPHCSTYDKIKITDEDVKIYFEWSERGKHKDKIKMSSITDGFNLLREGKRWCKVQLGIWQEGVIDLKGNIPYYELLGGYDGDEIMPRWVVDIMEKEMFKGMDAEIIEQTYQEVLKDKNLTAKKINGKD